MSSGVVNCLEGFVLQVSFFCGIFRKGIGGGGIS
jgi:hypothetical protein